MKMLRDDLELRRKQEIHEIEVCVCGRVCVPSQGKAGERRGCSGQWLTGCTHGGALAHPIPLLRPASCMLRSFPYSDLLLMVLGRPSDVSACVLLLGVHEQERKNTHINDLMKKHERAFAEIKNYYNDITHNNLDLIKTLKEDVAEMKKREAQNEKLMYEIAQENKRLSEPLTKALKEVRGR